MATTTNVAPNVDEWGPRHDDDEEGRGSDADASRASGFFFFLLY